MPIPFKPAALSTPQVTALMPEPQPRIVTIIAELVRQVELDPDHIYVLSTSERIAVALVLNRPDQLAAGDTLLDAVDRLGLDWLAAALHVQRNGWQ